MNELKELNRVTNHRVQEKISLLVMAITSALEQFGASSEGLAKNGLFQGEQLDVLRALASGTPSRDFPPVFWPREKKKILQECISNTKRKSLFYGRNDIIPPSGIAHSCNLVIKDVDVEIDGYVIPIMDDYIAVLTKIEPKQVAKSDFPSVEQLEEIFINDYRKSA